MSLLATRMANWRVESPEFDKNMTRSCEYGALDFFVSQTNSPNSLISPLLKERVFQSIGNSVQIPVIDYDGNVTVSNTRSCTIQDSENTSSLVTINFVTYSIGFTMVPSLYMNNDISYEHDFLRKMEKHVRALSNALDSAAVTALETNKTGVFNDALNYTVSSNVLEVPNQMALEVIGDMTPIMRANCFPGKIHIIGNATIDSIIRKAQEHGANNDVNKSLEYDDKIFHFTNNIVDNTGMKGTFFAVADGNVGILTRVDRESLRRSTINTYKWDHLLLPMLNMEVGSLYYTDVGDQSSIAGAASADITCGIKEHFGFSVDVAFVVAWNSATSAVPNPIVKAELEARTAGMPFGKPVYIINSPLQVEQVTP